MKRIISWIMLAAMLLLSACGAAEMTPQDTAAAPAAGTSDTTEAVTAEAVTTEPEPAFPAAADYNGRVFTVIACDEGVPYTYFENPEETTGEGMNDAIYDRNRQTEEYLHIKIQLVTDNYKTVPTQIANSVAAADGAYDMGNIHIVDGAAPLVTGGSLLDLNTLSTVDFGKPYWNQSFTETLTIHKPDGNYLYLASGDMIVPNARVIVFNKEMMQELHRDTDLYEEVRKGKWTLDRLGALCADVIADLDGNGKYDAYDRYAFGDLGNTGLGTSFIHASGLLLAQVQETGSLEYCFDNARMLTLMEKLDTYLFREYNAKKTVNISTAEFGNGQVLFGSQVLLKLQVLREYDTDFGILPFPKFDETQKSYYSSVWNGLLCVPVSVNDAAFSGHVMEVLNAVSAEVLSPVYFKRLLESKFSQDAASGEMLELIFDSLVYDFGFCFDNRVNLFAFASQRLIAGDLNLASFAEANRNVYAAHYQQILDAAQKAG